MPDVKKLNSQILIGLSILSLFAAFPPFAEQTKTIIKTECINKDPFYFSGKTENYTKEEVDRKKNTLKLEGILLPNKFSYTCTLSNNNYNITGFRPKRLERGMCGGDPRIVFSMQKNGITIIDKVFLEKSCFSDLFNEAKPYIKNFKISKGSMKANEIQFIISDGKSERAIYLEKIDQKKIDCLVAKGYLNKSIKQRNYTECLQSLIKEKGE